MTVWIVNPFDNLPTEGCRPQRYWLMAEAFARAGHTVTYWTSDFSHARKSRRVTVPCERSDAGFEVIQIPTRPYRRNVCWARVLSHCRLARDFAKLAEARRPFPDVVVASTPPLGLCDAARRVARRCGAFFVCDIQDAWPETFVRLLPHGLGWLGAILFAPFRRMARRLYRTADLVTGVSRRYAKLSGRDDFLLAYHGIEAAAEDAGCARCACASRARRLVYVGNLGEGYDLETVIEAVARRGDLTLDIAGLGPKESRLRALVAARKVGDRVRFHGYLDADALETLLARCDAGVVPLNDDSWVGLPYKLCDYLRAGLPVLSSLGGECGELLARTACGRLYGSGDPDSFLRARDALPRDPVALPEELRADRIYAQYVRHVVGVARPSAVRD